MAGSTLVGEILACRESYVRQGGNDHGILSTLAQLEAEARALVANANKKVVKKKCKYNNRSMFYNQCQLLWILERVMSQF